MRAKQIIFLFVMLFLVILLVPLMFPSSFPGFNKIIRPLDVSSKIGSLNVAGKPPQVYQIYMNDSTGAWLPLGLSLPIGGSNAQFQGVVGGNKNIGVMAMIYDMNGDCASFNVANQKAYVCSANPGTQLPCNPANANFTLNGVSVTGPISNLCNITFQVASVNYWRRFGNSSVNVTIQDTDLYYNDTTQYWYFNPTIGLEYPFPNEPVLLGSVNGLQWNDGRPVEGDNITNRGNVRLSVSWNASNFTENPPGTDKIPTGVNFCIDRDTTRGGGAYAEQCMSNTLTTQLPYYPTNNIRRCNNDACTSDEDGGTDEAFYLLYWHINVPAVGTGQYNNTIWYDFAANYSFG